MHESVHVAHAAVHRLTELADLSQLVTAPGARSRRDDDHHHHYHHHHHPHHHHPHHIVSLEVHHHSVADPGAGSTSGHVGVQEWRL